MKIKFVLSVISLFTYSIVNAQQDFSGIWNGTLNIAGELHLVLHVTQMNDRTYSGTLDSPDQNVSGIKCDKVEVSGISGNMLSFAISKLRVSYTGKLVNDSTIIGTFTQGVSIPLDLHRSSRPYVAKVI